jgi:hypothetical protein
MDGIRRRGVAKSAGSEFRGAAKRPEGPDSMIIGHFAHSTTKTGDQ